MFTVFNRSISIGMVLPYALIYPPDQLLGMNPRTRVRLKMRARIAELKKIYPIETRGQVDSIGQCRLESFILTHA